MISFTSASCRSAKMSQQIYKILLLETLMICLS